MEKIYEQAKDLHVKNYIVYAGLHTFSEQEEAFENVTTLFKDPDRLELADPDEVHDAFVKGILLIRGAVGMLPLSYGDEYLYKPTVEVSFDEVVGQSANIHIQGYQLMNSEIEGATTWIMYSSIEFYGEDEGGGGSR